MLPTRRRSFDAYPSLLQAGALLLLIATAVAGCQRQEPQEDGKVYTSTKGGSAQGGSGGGSGSSSNQQPDNAQPLDSPANTVNGRASQASDNGSTQAPSGQVTTNPGAPDAHNAKAAGPPPKQSTPTGSH